MTKRHRHAIINHHPGIRSSSKEYTDDSDGQEQQWSHYSTNLHKLKQTFANHFIELPIAYSLTFINDHERETSSALHVAPYTAP